MRHGHWQRSEHTALPSAWEGEPPALSPMHRRAPLWPLCAGVCQAEGICPPRAVHLPRLRPKDALSKWPRAYSGPCLSLFPRSVLLKADHDASVHTPRAERWPRDSCLGKLVCVWRRDVWVELAGAGWSAQMHACETICDPEKSLRWERRGEGGRSEAGCPHAAGSQSKT